jgi:4-hydroxybenzoate polyprenyltransferase
VSQQLKDYFSLIRLYNQVGTLLLFAPCLIGLIISHNFSLSTIALFLLSSFVARSCGCILNDIADKNIDARTPTTSNRVLAQNKLTTAQAIKFIITIIIISLPLLIFYSTHVYIPLICVGIIVIIYPYSKRFFPAPQLFLGLAYASGFIIAIVHSLNVPIYHLHPKMFVVYSALVLWVIFFDTLYAKRDFTFDVQNGIKSSTRLFGSHYLIFSIFFMMISVFCLFALYTHWVLFILVTIIYGLLWNFKHAGEFSKVNMVLLFIILLEHIMISSIVETSLGFIILGVSVALQVFLTFLRYSKAFNLNVVCAILLAVLFAL